MQVIVATDGSALRNPSGPGGWAWCVDNERWHAGAHPKASNQVMEMYAIYRALVDIPLEHDLLIQTDSAFCVNMVGKDGRSGWMKTWKRNGWVKADKKAPSNLLVVKKLDEALAARKGQVRFEWVRGHNGHSLNGLADRLCTAASGAQDRGHSIKTGPGWSEKKMRTLPEPVARKRPVVASTVRRAEEPRERMLIAVPEPKLVVNLCSSCGKPINPLSNECSGCSD